jgi:electron transport complex protein RnfD
MSKAKEYSSMTKDKLMTYTFIALLILAIVTAVIWWSVDTPSGWNQGLTVVIISVISVGVAVGLEILISKVASDSTMNIMSAAVFGFIVALSYSLGIPIMNTGEILPLEAPEAFFYVAFISAIGLVLFKKIQGLAGRKYVNPAAAAKLVAFLGSFGSIFLAVDHAQALGVPSLAGPIGYDIIGGNGAAAFSTFMTGCFASRNAAILGAPTQNDVFSLLIFDKFHGWIGGASSLAVIIVGIGLFILARRYIKWRITLSYFVTVAVMAALLNFAYPGGDLLLRLGFEIFIGSSIFLAFFMATDPASTPLTYTGQIIFGVGLGVLTVLIQTYLNFYGGSILALVIMNLTSPMLDKVGRLKPTTEKKEPKLPKAKQFTEVKNYDCIRCGACMRVCCHKLSPILIKEAFDKANVEALSKLNADYCDGCGHCSFVCPARIDLKGSVLRSKAMLRGK